MRLIDADYLKNKLINNCSIDEGGIPLKDHYTHEKILELYPTADAEPVRHGHWEEVEIKLIWCQDDIDIMYKCSCCGGSSGDRTNYCPHCGAKMDEVENGNE